MNCSEQYSNRVPLVAFEEVSADCKRYMTTFWRNKPYLRSLKPFPYLLQLQTWVTLCESSDV
jgi:hypothetical protein